MGELYNPYPKLPKNIRQIGERDQVVKLYVEDYVNTYLKRLYPAGGQDLRVGLLLGNMEMQDGTPYIFIDGAMEMEDVPCNGETVEFTEQAWKRAYQNLEQMFPRRTVQGWFLCGAAGCQLSPLNYWKEHVQYFPGKNQMMYLNSGLEGEESIYITSEDGFYRLQGHAIYYERNQMMQDYMVLRKEARRVDSGGNDNVIRDFRQRMEERQVQAGSKRSTVGLLSGICSALAVVVLAGGIVMFNNYEKMRQMEGVIASVMPEQVRNQPDYTLGDGDVLIEEAEGKVFPTAAEEGSKAESSSAASQTQDHEAAQGDVAAAATKPAATQAATEAPVQTAAQTPAETSPALPKPSAKEIEAAAAAGKIYMVEDGETLYGICYKLFGDLKKMNDICRLNGLDDQNRIFSGQNLILP